MKIKVIHTPTLELFNKVNNILKNNLDEHDFEHFEQDTCINLDYGFADVDFYKEQNAEFLTINDLPKFNGINGFKLKIINENHYVSIAKRYIKIGYEASGVNEDGSCTFDLFADFNERYTNIDYIIVYPLDKSITYGYDNSNTIIEVFSNDELMSIILDYIKEKEL